jgi:hypothetical protein
VHLVGFTIEIYYDARTYERQSRGTFFRPRACNVTRQEMIYGKIPVACLIIKYVLSSVQLPAESRCSFI